MEALEQHYLFILRIGLIWARNAAFEETPDRVRIELEHLHEVPTLMGESNLQRHLYYLRSTVPAYVDSMRMCRPGEVQGVENIMGPRWLQIANVIEHAAREARREITSW